MKNETMRFIDSCVGNIARKIEDEFNENDHPRDKGGKFTSKGSEGKGGESEPDTAKTFHSSKQIAEEVKKDLREKYAKAHGGEQLPETDIEKAAKEELRRASEKFEKEDINELIDTATEYAEDEESAHELLDKLGWDHEGIDTEEGLKEAIKSAVRREPKKAYEILSEEMQGINSKIDLEETEEDPHAFPGKVVNWGRARDVIEEFEASGIDVDAAASDLGIELEGDDDRWKLGDLEKKVAYDEKLLKKAEKYIKSYRSGN